MAHLCDGLATVLANTAIADTVVFSFCRERRRASRHLEPKIGCTPLEGKTEGKPKSVTSTTPPEESPAPLDAARPQRINGKVVTSGRQGMASQACKRSRERVFHTRSARRSALKRSERSDSNRQTDSRLPGRCTSSRYMYPLDIHLQKAPGPSLATTPQAGLGCPRVPRP